MGFWEDLYANWRTWDFEWLGEFVRREENAFFDDMRSAGEYEMEEWA